MTRTFDQSLRPSWRFLHSQIYLELAEVESAGSVKVVEHGARRSKTNGIMGFGRAELRRWLVDDEPDWSQRNESGLPLSLTPLLDQADRRATCERDLVHIERDLTALQELWQRRRGDLTAASRTNC